MYVGLAISTMSFLYCVGMAFYTHYNSSPEPMATSRSLRDFDLLWRNQYNKPVDQISIMINSTGEIVEADLMFYPYVEPGSMGLFTAIVDTDKYDQITSGYTVINARTR